MSSGPYHNPFDIRQPEFAPLEFISQPGVVNAHKFCERGLPCFSWQGNARIVRSASHSTIPFLSSATWNKIETARNSATNAVTSLTNAASRKRRDPQWLIRL